MKDKIQEMLQGAGIAFKNGPRSFILDCPKCFKSQKLYIRKTDGRFICFYCSEINNFKGKPEYVLSLLTKLPITEIKKILFGDDSDDTRDSYVRFVPKDFLGDNEEEEEIVIETETILPEVKYPPSVVTVENHEGAVKYLESRGVTLEIAKQYKLMYDVASKRIVFPVTYQNRILGWQGRYIGKTEYYDEETDSMVSIPKILTTPGLARDKTLMFRDRLFKSEHCVLCEGPFDAIKAHLCGGNVASMGKIVSRHQLDLIRQAGVNRLYLALDPDAAREARKIVQSMKDMEIFDMRPTDAKDLGEMSFEDVKKLFDNASKLDNSKVLIYLRNPFNEQ